MIIKILDPSSTDFNGVKYNEKKIEKGTGELTLMKNFPSFINEKSSQQEVRNYFKSVSKNDKVKKPQFHAVISTKFQEHSKDELTNIAMNFMEEMGYGSQPYIAVFHNDTDNNHIHLVSTRIDKLTGKKIKDGFEKLNAQKALSKVMEKLYSHNNDKELSKLLNYKIGSLSQLETLLTRSGYRICKITNDEKNLKILKNGVEIRSISGDQLLFNNSKNDHRARQLKAIILKYKDIYYNKVFKVEDNRKSESKFPKVGDEVKEYPIKIEYVSELQKKLKDVFGLDVIFHHTEENKPFGYTIIDHKTGRIFKGSEVVKMNELFEFTSNKIDKKTFEKLKDYNIKDQVIKERLIEFLKISNQSYGFKDFMLFQNGKVKDLVTYRKIQFEVKDFIRNQKQENNNIKLFTSSEDNKLYVVHTRMHYVGELKTVIGEKFFQEFLTPSPNDKMTIVKTNKNEVAEAVNELLVELMKSSFTAKDPAEDELKKKRRKKK